MGLLKLQLPAKWPVKIYLLEGQPTFHVVEQQRYMGIARTIEITQELVKKTVTSEDFAAELDPRGSGDALQPLDLLGHKGVLVNLPAEIREDASGRTDQFSARLFVAVVLPSRLAVKIELAGPHFFVPADEELVKTIARSMTLKPEAGDPHEVAAGEQSAFAGT